MDNSEKRSTRSTARDAISLLDPRGRLFKYAYKVAENLVLGDTTLQKASLDSRTLAEDLAQEALAFLVKWKRVKTWTFKDLRRVAVWKVRKLVKNQRVTVRREMQHTVPVEDLPVEQHYDDEASHEEHGPSFRARVQAPAAEHVGRKSAEMPEEFLTDVLREVELFLKQETRMTSTSIAKALALIKCWGLKSDDALKITESGNIGQRESWIAAHLGWTIEEVRKTRRRIVEHRGALSAWLKAHGRADLLWIISRR